MDSPQCSIQYSEPLAGEHTHLEFFATSADERLLRDGARNDFEDNNWALHLKGPDGNTLYADGITHTHGDGNVHSGRMPNITTARSNGRLSMMLQRDSADAASWVGTWTLMIHTVGKGYVGHGDAGYW